MIPYPNIDPNIISIGPIHIRWYGAMYVLGFLAAYILIQKQKASRQIGLVGTAVQDLIFYLAVGIIVGGRLGYIVFYQYHDYLFYLNNPLEIIATWRGGMAFHGGLLGGILAGWLFSHRRKLPFWVIADSTIVTVPVGLGFGRIGNFINGELWGRPTDVPWAMIFPHADAAARHPSQLYEALLEGLVLFILLWRLRQRSFPNGMMVVFFLLFYGIFRFFLEFFREPDVQIGFLMGYLTMGQFLCLAMILGALCLGVFIVKTQPTLEA